MSNSELTSYLGRSLTMLITFELMFRDGEHSGYSLVKAINQISNRLNLKVGTLYSQLEKYYTQEYIIRRTEKIQSKSTGRIRDVAFFSLSDKGIARLSEMQLEFDELQVILNKHIRRSYK